MNYVYYPDYLEHHGILGMKWGIRRYQNKDGTWTDEGKKHRGISIIKKGSSVKRITARDVDGTTNPAGLYTYGDKFSEYNYIKSAKNLPSVDSTYSGKAKEAKITKYEFVKDAVLIEGERTVNDFMRIYGSMTLKDFVDNRPIDNLASKRTAETYKSAAKLYPDRTVYDHYNHIKKVESADTISAKEFAHGYIHFTVPNDAKINGERKPIIQDFVSRYKDAGVDAIIDPEDYSASYTSPVLVINKDSVKKVSSKNIKL